MKNYEGIKGDIVERCPDGNEKCGAFLRLSLFLHRNAHWVALVALVLFIFPDTVLAGPDAGALWDQITGLIGEWVTRLGAVVMFVGGVMFGLGWKNDDAEQKSRGVSSMIAGAIVIAVAQLADQFF